MLLLLLFLLAATPSSTPSLALKALLRLPLFHFWSRQRRLMLLSFFFRAFFSFCFLSQKFVFCVNYSQRRLWKNNSKPKVHFERTGRGRGNLPRFHVTCFGSFFFVFLFLSLFIYLLLQRLGTSCVELVTLFERAQNFALCKTGKTALLQRVLSIFS